MSAQPQPLPAGTILAERFELHRELGRGGFGIAYLATDLVRQDRVVVKELAPSGTPRDESGILRLDEDPERSGHVLRQRFRQEAQLMRRVRSSGVPNLRATFAENGTAYVVTDYLANAETLARRLLREGRLSEETVREILVSLLDVLEKVHEAGILHRDIKPSNILLGPGGEVLLIDFGSARDYASTTQTVMYTPAYAPPEQLSERAVRGPGTDLYGLAATMYHALVGEPPPTAHDRVAGLPLPSVRSRRSDVDPILGSLLESMLSLTMGERPSSVEDVRRKLSDESEPAPILTLLELDSALAKARELLFDRRGCPSCDGVLVDVRPLRKLGCPVCREGMLRLRDLDENLCPCCIEGRLVTVPNEDPLAICPTCRIGRLSVRKRGLLGGHRVAECPQCRVTYEVSDRGWTRLLDEENHSGREWQQLSGRSSQVRLCNHCDAQFDMEKDGRWSQKVPAPRSGTLPLYADEWARIAAGLEPGVGNAACDMCRADFWIEGSRATLLTVERDPFLFAQDFLGRSLLIEDLRWIGAGKSSAQPGSVCDQCGSEFDTEPGGLRLVRSPDRTLMRHAGETHPSRDWHRLASNLPTAEEEDNYRERIRELLLEGYREGSVPFESQSEIDWRGHAVNLDSGAEATFTIDTRAISFGARFRKWSVARTQVDEVVVSGDEISIVVGAEAHAFRLDPVELIAQLNSGHYAVQIRAEDLGERLKN